jgi:hypothetical protein
MTPKQKALELFETYLTELVKYDFDTNNKYNQPYNEIAKQCAIISVNLILSEFYADDFYTEVKHELEKL